MSATTVINPRKSSLEFYLRRLHSLSGIVPLGLFLMFHLSANNTAIQGPDQFNAVINFLRGLPHLRIIEWVGIFGPLLYHALYGMIITPQFARDNLVVFSHPRNFAYYLQRITGVIAFVFIAVHIWQFWTVEDLNYDVVAESLKQPVWALAYAVGITSVVYHFANGLWNFMISWGITIGQSAQKISAIACGTLGLAVWAIGMMALWAFYGLNFV